MRFQEATGAPQVLVDTGNPDAGPSRVRSQRARPRHRVGQERPDPGQPSCRTTSSDRIGQDLDGRRRRRSARTPFASIQEAVDQAAPWDTIVVCAGLPGDLDAGSGETRWRPAQNGLTITKPLKIKGAGRARYDRSRPEHRPALAGATPYLRDGGGNVITISRQSLGSTDDDEEFVDISGVTISSPNVYAEAGVAFFNASGRIADSVVGPIRASTAEEVADNPHGWGVVMTNSLIASGAGAVERQVTITDSKVFGYQSGGILIDGARGPDGNADNTVRQGIREFGFVTDSVI